MNQTAIGSYIARKRREQNLTQEQLAQQLGVSNKTISKWENGKCMPDYSIIQRLCEVIHVSLPELMDGEDTAEDSVRVYDDEQILNLLRRTQELERQKGALYGLVLVVLGIASGAMSKTTGGTDVQNFISGVLMGLSVAEILAGIWTSAPEAVKTPPSSNRLFGSKKAARLFCLLLWRVLQPKQPRRELTRHGSYLAAAHAVIEHELQILPYGFLPRRICRIAAVGGQDGMRRTELTDRVQITFSIADPLPVLQRLAVAALKDDAIILQKRFLLSQTQIHDPVFRVRDHDLSHAGVRAPSTTQ